MQQHKVTGTDGVAYALGICPHHLADVIELLRSQIAAVTGLAVDSIVNTFGDSEELRVSGDDQPPDIDGEVLRIADHDLKHVGHTTAAGSGADVPDGAVAGKLPKVGGGGKQVGRPLQADHILESGNRPPGHVNQVGTAHVPSISDLLIWFARFGITGTR